MRNVKHPHGPLEPQDVEELLPWYVTGRVTREEARGIEAALQTMPAGHPAVGAQGPATGGGGSDADIDRLMQHVKPAPKP